MAAMRLPDRSIVTCTSRQHLPYFHYLSEPDRAGKVGINHGHCHDRSSIDARVVRDLAIWIVRVLEAHFVEGSTRGLGGNAFVHVPWFREGEANWLRL
jgi:hypothetical protein